MTDRPALFFEVMNPKEIGAGNALVLADIANGANRDTIRKRWSAGKYPGASVEFIKANLDWWGK